MAADASRPSWLQSPQVARSQKRLGVVEDDMRYGEKLVHYTYATKHDDLHLLEYRSLHRLNIFCLQNRLARLKGHFLEKIDVSDEESLEIENTLHRYSTLLRNLSFQYTVYNLSLTIERFSQCLTYVPADNSSPKKPTRSKITPTCNPSPRFPHPKRPPAAATSLTLLRHRRTPRRPLQLPLPHPLPHLPPDPLRPHPRPPQSSPASPPHLHQSRNGSPHGRVPAKSPAGDGVTVRG